MCSHLLELVESGAATFRVCCRRPIDSKLITEYMMKQISSISVVTKRRLHFGYDPQLTETVLHHPIVAWVSIIIVIINSSSPKQLRGASTALVGSHILIH